MSVVLLEDGSRTLLESGDALLLEAISVAVDTSFVQGFIDGADTRLAVRQYSLATLAADYRVSARDESRVSVVQSTQATVRE